MNTIGLILKGVLPAGANTLNIDLFNFNISGVNPGLPSRSNFKWSLRLNIPIIFTEVGGLPVGTTHDTMAEGTATGVVSSDGLIDINSFESDFANLITADLTGDGTSLLGMDLINNVANPAFNFIGGMRLTVFKQFVGPIPPP